MIQNYLRMNNINYTILRLFNIFGPRSNAVVGTFWLKNYKIKT